jgi:hypothetical protein
MGVAEAVHACLLAAFQAELAGNSGIEEGVSGRRGGKLHRNLQEVVAGNLFPFLFESGSLLSGRRGDDGSGEECNQTNVNGMHGVLQER